MTQALPDFLHHYVNVQHWSVIPVCRPVPEGGCLQHGPDCEKPGKYPLVKWARFIFRPTTEAEVRRWLRQFPNAQWAVVTGSVSGVFVLDADDARARDMLDFATMDRRVPVVTRGCEDRAHYYFRIPAGLTVATVRKAAGMNLDVCGDGAIVVLPPAIHRTGEAYRWHSGAPPTLSELGEP